MPGTVKPGSFRFYRGGSMRTAFRPGDCVFFSEVSPERLRKGDVIVFNLEHPDGPDVIHRIVDIGDGFVLARGDDNPPLMVDKVPFTCILGRVTGVEGRDGSRRGVSGGTRGLLRAALVARGSPPARVGRILYSILRRSGICRLFWKPRIETIALGTDPGSVVRLVHRGRTIGKWCRERRLLTVRKPYDLVVRTCDADARRLRPRPGPSADSGG